MQLYMHLTQNLSVSAILHSP